MATLSVLLGKPAPVLMAYRPETIIAEKCEAMVSLGMINTRMKNFYDIWYLCNSTSFQAVDLRLALQATFSRRGTLLPQNGVPLALTGQFAMDPLKQKQWRAFVTKSALGCSHNLQEITSRLHEFLHPVLLALSEGNPLETTWTPAMGWHPR